MKRIIAIAALAVGLASCQPDPYKSIGERQNLITGINGTWEISDVKIIDLTLPVPEERDISDFFVAMNSRITVTFDAENNSYTVKDSQLAANPFGSGGSYSFNQPDFPDQLTFTDATMGDLNFKLLNMVRKTDNEFGLQLTRSHCGENYVSYKYTFKRLSL